MHALAKIIRDEDGDLSEDASWHFVDSSTITPDVSLLCTGYHIDLGAGCGEYEVKKRKRGGITCELCLLTLKYYKNIKL